MHADPYADAPCNERREGPVEPRRLAADCIGAIQNPHEQRNDSHYTDEAQLFGDHGKQKIGVRFRQVEKLLDARAESDTKPFAATERDQRMRKLITLVQRIGPRVEESGQSLQPIRRGDHDRGQGDR